MPHSNFLKDKYIDYLLYPKFFPHCKGRCMRIRSKLIDSHKHRCSELSSMFVRQNKMRKYFHSSSVLKGIHIFSKFSYKIDLLDSLLRKRIHWKFDRMGMHIDWCHYYKLSLQYILHKLPHSMLMKLDIDKIVCWNSMFFHLDKLYKQIHSKIDQLDRHMIEKKHSRFFRWRICQYIMFHSIFVRQYR